MGCVRPSSRDTVRTTRHESGVVVDMIDEKEDDPRPNNGNYEGVTCCECHSVIFNVGKLMRHVDERGHNWFKSGDDVAVNMKVLTEDNHRWDE